MNFVKKFFSKLKPAQASRLYSPDETPDSLDNLETSLELLRSIEPLVKLKDSIEKLVEYEMTLALTALTDPSRPQETAQFFRGAFWLAKQIGQKLNGAEDEILRLQKQLTEEKKRTGELFTIK